MEKVNSINTWAVNEFKEVNFGDGRLTERLIRLSNDLSVSPESSINQACGSWSQTKAAYRFFKNEKVDEIAILSSHARCTLERSRQEARILAIQDTSYICYKNHPKTKGLGLISKRAGINKTTVETNGLIMHTTFVVNTKGLPLGLLDQIIYARESLPETKKAVKKASHNNGLTIEEKESVRWLNAITQTHALLKASNTNVVTICDREADIYDFFEHAQRNNADFLVRACKDRYINKKSLYTEIHKEKLWSFMQKQASQGQIQVEIPAQKNRSSRIATLDIHFSSFAIKPPRNNIRNKTEKLADLILSGIYVIERNPPKNEEALEWLLITNLSINNFDSAIEKVRWYCLRWRIEVFHKILKSGFSIEACRLSTAKRLIRYITLMSIIAWRIFYITLIARVDPELPCTVVLEDEEWKVLYVKINQTKNFPKTVPSIKTFISWVAQLGGFLARKNDREPGPMVVWRGWRRLADLCDMWSLAHA